MANITTRSFHYKASRDIISVLINFFFMVVCLFIVKSLLRDYLEDDLDDSKVLVSTFLIVLIATTIIIVIGKVVNIYCSKFSIMTISQDEIIYCCGWLTKTTTTIPSNKIRTCSKSSSVLQRVCGTMDISIKTTGDGSEIYFCNIEDGEEAYQLISQIAKRNER